MRSSQPRLLWGILCLAALLFVSASVQPAEKQAEQDKEYYRLMRAFAESFEQIERNYVKEVDRRKLMEAAVEGMLDELDPYSNYIDPEELADFNQQVDQEFGGIGIQVTGPPAPGVQRLTVISPLPGTPAYKAGVQAGDVIMEIEGKSTEGVTVEEAVKLLKGKPGKPVTIGVKHVGSDEIEQITIERAVIQVATVRGDQYKSNGEWDYMLDDENKIGYIRVSHFSRRTAEELREVLRDLQDRGLQGLILDLRFNPGGLLTQAVEVSDLFIEQGTIVSTDGRNTSKQEWTASRHGTFADFPMAVLVNRYSASASEIVSACLQDHDRAVIVGHRTWGKGSVQKVIKLEEGSSALKLTTASYHRPSGENIHRFPDAKKSDEWGVHPDEGFQVEFSPEEIQQYLRYRRERDVLSQNGPPESDFEDRQLTAALEYINKRLGVEAPAEAEGTPEDPEAEKAQRPEAKSSDDTSALRRRRPLQPAASAASL